MKRAVLFSVVLLSMAAFGQQAKKPAAKRPEPSRVTIARQKQRIEELEAENTRLRADNERLAADSQQARAYLRDTLADADNLASAGKKLLDEHQHLADRYNDLVRDYNNVLMQARIMMTQAENNQAMLAQIKTAAEQQGQACRALARSQALSYMMSNIPKFTAPAVRQPIHCSTQYIGSWASTTCQ